jgi:3',5'-cyclic AMP phosphodiesterase CpdA
LSTGRLYAISDLHVAYAENRQIVEGLRPTSDDDWLIVTGDVGELFADIEWALSLLSRRFAKVIWTPGNHELWTPRRDPMPARGVERYEALVHMCQSIGVTTPEDAYPVWRGIGGPALVVPLFLLYDYSFRAPGTHTKEESVRRAYDAGVVCTDEVLLFPDPYPTRDDWCSARLAVTEQRLAARDPLLPTVLVNHYPLIRDPTRVLHFPEFAQWCGTERTADWHRRFNAVTMIYGHLHIPRVTWHDGVCFQEVSVGYPREWSRRPVRPWLRPVLPVTPAKPRPDIGRTHTGRQ